MAKIRLKKIYKCDPYLNEECSKTGCVLNGGYCGATMNKKYAVIDCITGKPVLLPEFNMIELIELEEETNNEPI